MSSHRLVLASASPRRLELLRQIGLNPLVMPAELPERAEPGETALETVARLARAKGSAVATRLPQGTRPDLILAADTAVVLDGQPLGKPADAAEAETMLRRLRGRTHEVLTAVWLQRTDGTRAASGVESTRVVFRDYDERLLRAYVASGEPLDKAGAYAIQGRGALLAERIDGSWSNVVGFPLEPLPRWLADIGLRLEDMLDWMVAG